MCVPSLSLRAGKGATGRVTSRFRICIAGQSTTYPRARKTLSQRFPCLFRLGGDRERERGT